MPLAVEYPVNSMLELEIEGSESHDSASIITGFVYCTDEVSNTVVLQKSLVHTTLASEIHILNAASIKSKKVIKDHKEVPLELPTNVSQKQLEDKEKRAIKLAEEAMKHINQKATPEGQAVFYTLLKACNEVSWKGESIVVLREVQVDPPYGPEQCKLINASKKDANIEASLERVKRIVAVSSQ